MSENTDRNLAPIKKIINSFAKKPTKESVYFIIGIFFALLLFGIGGYHLGKQNTLATIKIQKSNNISENVKTFTPSPSDNKEVSNEICLDIEGQAHLNKFYSNLSTAMTAGIATLFDSKMSVSNNGLKRFMESYDFVSEGKDFQTSLEFYRDYSGIETTTQYEHLTPAIRNYDKEKNLFLSLDEGMHTVEVWSDTGYWNHEVTVKHLGERKFLVYDNFFPPAGTVSRNYLHYDEQNGNLIYFSVLSYNDRKGTKSSFEDDVYIVEKYPDKLQEFIDEIEVMVSKI